MHKEIPIKPMIWVYWTVHGSGRGCDVVETGLFYVTLVLDTYNDISIILCNDMKSAAWKNTRVHFSNRCDSILLQLYSR